MREQSSDRGAIAVLVGLSMSILLIFAGLAIDLGASYAKRQELQNGADAGALALAQEIAPDECVGPSQGTADYFVQANVRNDPVGTAALPTCPSTNSVRVRADATQDHWFLPIVGRKSSPIAATATVEWGTPIVPSTIPIAISACAFESAVDIPSVDNKIAVYFPDSSSSSTAGPPPCGWHPDYPAGGFGLLDNSYCVSEIDLSDWTVGSAPGGSALGGSGCKFSTLLNMRHLIPIFDGGSGVIHQGQPARYEIKTFAAFTLTGYHLKHGSDKHGGEACFGTVPEWGTANYCIVGEFEEWVTLEEAEFELRPPGPADTVIFIRMTD